MSQTQDVGASHSEREIKSEMRSCLTDADFNKSFREKIIWTGENNFRIGDVSFRTDISMNRALSGDGHLTFAKSLPFLDAYFQYIDFTAVENMLEIGFFRGGSAAFFFELLNLKKLVSIEFKQDLTDEFVAYQQSSELRRDGIKVCTGVNQADRARLKTICDTEFGGEPLDLVVDDGSHMDELTTASLEALLCRVRPGGMYVVEDWSWAHAPGSWQDPGHAWRNKPALTNMLFKLQMAFASHVDWFDAIIVLPFMFFIKIGAGRPTAEFSLDGSYLNRGKILTPL